MTILSFLQTNCDTRWKWQANYFPREFIATEQGSQQN